MGLQKERTDSSFPKHPLRRNNHANNNNNTCQNNAPGQPSPVFVLTFAPIGHFFPDPLSRGTRRPERAPSLTRPLLLRHHTATGENERSLRFSAASETGGNTPPSVGECVWPPEEGRAELVTTGRRVFRGSYVCDGVVSDDGRFLVCLSSAWKR